MAPVPDNPSMQSVPHRNPGWQRGKSRKKCALAAVAGPIVVTPGASILPWNKILQLGGDRAAQFGTDIGGEGECGQPPPRFLEFKPEGVHDLSRWEGGRDLLHNQYVKSGNKRKSGRLRLVPWN